jgi:hypothetical protein
MRVALVLIALGFVLAPAVARADGDPASDVLYLQDVYLPYQRPSEGAAADLSAAVAEANRAGYPMKVAVIASVEDLGLVGSLFGKPQVYAGFLGAEIRSFFTGHLLVVMPSGFGAWFNRYDTAPQRKILAEEKIGPGDSEGLTRSAAAAVRALAMKDKSRPRVNDKVPPETRAIAARVKRGMVARLMYAVYDDSGKSREEVRVYGANLLLLAVLKDPLERAAGQLDEVRWKAPRFKKPQHLRFCVVGIDPLGNHSPASCAKLEVL